MLPDDENPRENRKDGTSRAVNFRDFFERIKNAIVNENEEETGHCRRFVHLVSLWNHSLRFRIISYIYFAAACVLIASALGIFFVLRTQLVGREAVDAMDQYTIAYEATENFFEATDLPTREGLQQIAQLIVPQQGDATHAIQGMALLPENYDSELEKDIEPVTSFTVSIRDLISEDFRKQVRNSDEPRWTSVVFEQKNGEKVRGIIVGQPILIPESGEYDFYVGYAVGESASTVMAIVVVFVAGFFVLVIVSAVIVYVVIRFLIDPIREISANARRIADGEYDVRLDVKGDDELAQVSRSFNEMAQSIEKQIERYERSTQVQQKFVSAVSHELRSPVTTIRMAGQLIYDKRDELSEPLRRSVELQYDQLVNLDMMLSDLLEISRYDAGEMVFSAEVSDIASIVEKVVRDQQPLAEENGVRVSITIEGETFAKVDERRIERIVRNLVVNGLEHAEGQLLKVRITGNETAVAVEVSDHGIGLDAEQASHVFDRFWRADASRVRKSGGTGLGLTIAYEDAQLHGGTLECIGELGVGATFLLTLPYETGSEYVKPLPLRLAAAEENWDDTTSGISPETPENKQSASARYDSSSTQEIPAIRVGANPKGRNIEVDVPSLGVAVIRRLDTDDAAKTTSATSAPENTVSPEAPHDEMRDETREKSHARDSWPYTGDIPAYRPPRDTAHREDSTTDDEDELGDIPFLDDNDLSHDDN